MDSVNVTSIIHWANSPISLLSYKCDIQHITLPDVLESFVEVVLVVDLNLKVEIVLVVLLGQSEGVTAVARLPAHADRDVHVKVHLPVLK